MCFYNFKGLFLLERAQKRVVFWVPEMYMTHTEHCRYVLLFSPVSRLLSKPVVRYELRGYREQFPMFLFGAHWPATSHSAQPRKWTLNFAKQIVQDAFISNRWQRVPNALRRTSAQIEILQSPVTDVRYRPSGAKTVDRWILRTRRIRIGGAT